ncbi:MAG: Rieske 2Fe-2S domain-containing protein [Bacteroidales bacterium]
MAVHKFYKRESFPYAKNDNQKIPTEIVKIPSMIYNQWYIILGSKELKRNKPLKIKRLNLNLALWRNNKNEACCIADLCCHRGASLGCGKIVNGSLKCPFHGFTYNKSGNVTTIPANGKNSPVPKSFKVQSYKTFEDYGFIWMWWGDDDKIPGIPFFFKELKGFSYSGFKDHWNVHYSRAIETQLDVVHLPFVHRTTIGRGDKTLVNGPVVFREKELITFYVDNVKDDGKSIPLKPNEVKDYQKLFHLQFHYPNIWQNYISSNIRAFAAFVPIDDENTAVYIRYYQKLVKLPLLKELMNFMGKLLSIIILWQDKRVTTTQRPKKSGLTMEEHLIMGDSPIIEYRKHKQFLVESSSK